MCASAREELLRPGLRGGGGGKPLLRTNALAGAAEAGATGGTTVFSGFLLATVCALAFTVGATTLTFGAAFTAGLLAVFRAVFGVVFGAVFNMAFGMLLSTFLDGTLAVNFRTGFLAVGFNASLAKGFLGVGLGLDARTGFLDGDFAAALTAGLPALAAAFTTGLAVVFTTAFFGADLTGGFASGLARGFDALIVLTATLVAGLLFFVTFAFTTGLL